jgi:CelD/BcsL family acetyltransferase involved in cellulose biosynthesis
LALYRHDDAKPFKCRTLYYCGSRELYPDHVDIICAEEDSQKCSAAAFSFLFSNYRKWDTIHISNMSDTGNLTLFLDNGRYFLDADVQHDSVSPYILLEGSFEEYLSGFKQKTRDTLKRKRKKLFQLSEITYSSYDLGKIDDEMKLLFVLHELRSRQKGRRTTFAGPELIDFHVRLAREISKNGWLQLKFIRHDNKVIAAFYGYEFGGHLFYYQMGIDPAWGNYSLGTVIFYEIIQEAFSKKLKEFDFLRGDEEYKKRWTKKQRTLVSATVYNKTVRGKLSKLFAHSKNATKRLMRLLLRRNENKTT